MDNKKILSLPKKKNNAETDSIETPGSVVIVGANGSGKTRLGSWIEAKAPQKVHRIAAQKSLTMLPSVQIQEMEKANNTLLFGHPDDQYRQNKMQHRWGNHPNTLLLNDYDKLMVALFSEYAQIAVEFYQKYQKSDPPTIVPMAKLNIVNKIWDHVFPHRKLKITQGKIESQIEGKNPYNGSEMSDGERAVFYLIGQCLCAPQNAIIVIDEPESHLHKTIQSKLWDEIEQERLDCLFVYFTHDIDFATSRTLAKKIWLKDYDGQHWDWEEIPPNEDIPETLLLQTLGSRKPILFVEGEETSFEKLYNLLYPDFTIIPSGSCKNVIARTISFNSLKQLHHLQAYGIVDRDYRTEEDMNYLKERHIFPLSVAIIENLFVCEEIIKLIAKKLSYNELQQEDLLCKLKTLLLEDLEKEKELHVSVMVADYIDAVYKKFNSKVRGKEAVKEEINKMSELLSAETIYTEISKKIEIILTNKNYQELLKVYKNKGVIGMASKIFQLKYPDYVQRVLDDNPGEILQAMKKYVPSIQ